MEATQASETKQFFDVHKVISERIIEQLGKGIIPWQRLWGQSGPPRNLITKQPYKGLNALLLGMEEYEHNLFLTFDQVNEAGGKVKRGSKGHSVIRWEKQDSKENSTEPEFRIKYYSVFNIAQCEKLPEKYLETKNENPVILHPDSILSSLQNPPKVQAKESDVWYDVVEDIIHIPKKKAAKKDAEYYATLFRQLMHCTGHDARLARKGIAEMSEIAAEPLYSKEDLIAEMGVCFLLSATGLSYAFSNNESYAKNWSDKFGQDKKLVVIAAGQAQKAVEHILNIQDGADKQ